MQPRGRDVQVLHRPAAEPGQVADVADHGAGYDRADAENAGQAGGYGLFLTDRGMRQLPAWLFGLAGIHGRSAVLAVAPAQIYAPGGRPPFVALACGVPKLVQSI